MDMKKYNLHDIMQLAWQFVRRNGYSMSEALKTAWRNIKVKMMMKQRIVKFYFQKVDGSLREAYGTLSESIVPTTGEAGRRANDTVQTYYDTEKGAWRCFKKANLIKIA